MRCFKQDYPKGNTRAYWLNYSTITDQVIPRLHSWEAETASKFQVTPFWACCLPLFFFGAQFEIVPEIAIPPLVK